MTRAANPAEDTVPCIQVGSYNSCESENPGADPFAERIARLPRPARIPRPVSEPPRGRVERRVDALEQGMDSVLDELAHGRVRDYEMATALHKLSQKTDEQAKVWSTIYKQLKRPIWLAVGAGVAALLRATVVAWGEDGAVTAAERQQTAQDVAAAVANSLSKQQDSGK